MNVELRIYKRFDTDLYSLHEAGYSLSHMIADAVCAYAKGSPLRIMVDEPIDFYNLGNQHLRIRAHFSNNEKEAIRMLDGIKPGYRNTFCKMVLRDALITENIGIFFQNAELRQTELENIKRANLLKYQNCRMISEYNKSYRQIKMSLTPTNSSVLQPENAIPSVVSPAITEAIASPQPVTSPAVSQVVKTDAPPKPVVNKPIVNIPAENLTEEELLDAFDNL